MVETRSFTLFFFFFFFFFLFFFITNYRVSAEKQPAQISTSFNRSSFPKDFIFGGASSAYQYEGAANEGGRGPSIWDTYSHKYPGKILDGSNGDVADDFYHRYKEDIQLLKQVGLNGFRMSISWSRVLPYGKLSKGVNKEGIAFYNNVINELLANGITPSVTIFHWDLPQALEDEYGGFLSPKIIDDYIDFAELCFKEFGDRVKLWVTFNEPWTFCAAGYDSGTIAGTHAPGRCSAWMNKGCPAGDSSTEPYLVAHHILLSHAAASKLYREKYKPSQKGQIGIVLVTNWIVPNSNSPADVKARERGLDFFYGWFLNPLTYGDYPKVMRSIVGDRLPKFTEEESKKVKGSFDFLGLNYYTSNFGSPLPPANSPNISYSNDMQVNLTVESNGKLIGERTGIKIFYSYPDGLRQFLIYTKKKYNDPIIYITENGYGEYNINTVKEGTNDAKRLKFYQGHFMAVKEAIDAGVKVKGFFLWSFLDTYEWPAGYKVRFGIVYVDYKDGLKRYLKTSAYWLKKFLA